MGIPNCTLLISSAGRRVELIRCFRRDAEALGIALIVIATDAQPEFSAACQVADFAYQVPKCTDSHFLFCVLDICRKHQVDLLVPTIDPELAIYAAHMQSFEDAGVTISLSSPRVVQIAGNKYETYRYFKTNGIAVPQTCLSRDFYYENDVLEYPVILKPMQGSSSLGIFKIKSAAELPPYELVQDYVVQEMMQGAEYTVNMYFDRHSDCRATIPHKRLSVRAGEVATGETERRGDLAAVSEQIAACLAGARGVLCYQAIITELNEVGVFEINARFGGGYPLAHQAGATFTRWLLEETAGLPCSANDNWKSGVRMLRYDAAEYTCEK
ncbi:MAG: ATP-grasp domain-containing protein [Caldilineaceae bacterium]